MQPPDVIFFKTLSTYMVSVVATKLREKLWQRLSTKHMALLVGLAFSKAAAMLTATNAFKNSG
jgi:hypothetical protein